MVGPRECGAGGRRSCVMLFLRLTVVSRDPFMGTNRERIRAAFTYYYYTIIDMLVAHALV